MIRPIHFFFSRLVHACYAVSQVWTRNVAPLHCLNNSPRQHMDISTMIRICDAKRETCLCEFNTEESSECALCLFICQMIILIQKL